ncbi:hypothetical protein V8G54_031575 [Vigna mungo]|uniref:Uncharacterized protein n=1 Tax=Vigna mungo TaxID=3915 RepID=A0AAQ3RH17_VIGMU
MVASVGSAKAVIATECNGGVDIGDCEARTLCGIYNHVQEFIRRLYRACQRSRQGNSGDRGKNGLTLKLVRTLKLSGRKEERLIVIDNKFDIFDDPNVNRIRHFG